MKGRILPRKSAAISESMQRRLGAYSLAASAAGVGLLAVSQAAEAKIIYTPANLPLKPNYSVFLDINGDGANDFSVLQSYASAPLFTGGSRRIIEGPFNHNGVVGHKFAGALKPGFVISSGKAFVSSNKSLVRIRTYYPCGNTSCRKVKYYGPWWNNNKAVNHRFLGIKFTVKGKTHYGWVRIKIAAPEKYLRTTITGYAYETVPNKPIIAGKTKGPDVITMRTDAGTLGHLALGRK